MIEDGVAPFDRRESLRKGVYILPNLFTTGSLFAGFYCIVSTLNGNYLTGAWFILVSSIFDALDGKVARLTGTTSKFGVEYDSLADLVAFGVAPGLLMYAWALKPFGKLGWLAAFLYVVCGALRGGDGRVQEIRRPADSGGRIHGRCLRPSVFPSRRFGDYQESLGAGSHLCSRPAHGQ